MSGTCEAVITRGGVHDSSHTYQRVRSRANKYCPRLLCRWGPCNRTAQLLPLLQFVIGPAIEMMWVGFSAVASTPQREGSGVSKFQFQHTYSVLGSPTFIYTSSGPRPSQYGDSR
jgi:hypothetical protein